MGFNVHGCRFVCVFNFLQQFRVGLFSRGENDASFNFLVGQPVLHWLGEHRRLAGKSTMAEKEDVHGHLGA